MSLVFAGITPHTPLLMPTIGKDSLTKLAATSAALEKLEEDLYLSKPDVLMVISPHGAILDDAFTINIASQFTTDFKEFGDITTHNSYKGELSIATMSREENDRSGLPVVLVSEPVLDHGVSVPLFYLAKHLPEIAVLPVGFSSLEAKTHVDFGVFLKEQIMKSPKRVAVIASGDLSHALTVHSPAPYHADGPAFDKAIQEYLSTKNTMGMLQMTPEFLSNAHECGFRTFLILMGILKGINYTYTSYAYEAPLGVGYLTATLIL